MIPRVSGWRNLSAASFDADAGAEEDGDDVDHLVGGGLGEAFDDAAFAEEVAEHEHADERRGRGQEEDAE